MSKNLIVILYFALAIVATISIVLVAVLSPGQFDKVFQGAVQILGLGSTAAVTIYLLGKNASTLEEVKTNTNGKLTALLDENKQLRDQLLAVVGSAPSVEQQQTEK